MYSSNSFNVCPHCGKANSLNARYCSGCGKQLAVPEEVVVCHKCHRPNSSMASFCGGCGAPLRVGAQTKICPKCHKEVNANANVCSCGYSFSSVKYASPEGSAVSKGSRSPAALDPRHKGARAIGVFMLIMVLLFAYLVMVPAVGRPGFLKNFDKGISFDADGKQLYGYDVIYQPIKDVIDGGFSALKGNFGIGGWIWAVIVVIFAFTLLIQLIAVIAQLVSAKRHKRTNWFHLAMAALSTLCVGLMLMGHFLFHKMEPFFLFNPETYGMGLVIYLIPIYYWLCFFFSIGFKQKKVKEQAA